MAVVITGIKLSKFVKSSGWFVKHRGGDGTASSCDVNNVKE